MVALRSLFDELGYQQLYPLLTRGHLFAPDARHAGELAATFGPDVAPMLELFALGRPVQRSSLGGVLGDVVASLASARLVEEAGGQVTTADWVAVPALGGVLLTGVPPTYATRASIGASAYLGPDSVEFASTLPSATGKRVLDLGTGCGIQGLLAMRGAREAVLSDIETRSLELAQLNQSLNAVDHPVAYVRSDCYDSLAGEQFDLVVSLPPYVPEVAGSATRSTVAAGPDGLAVVRRILRGLGEHLSPGGRLIARCQLLCDDDGPLLARELDDLAPGLERKFVLRDWHPLQPYVVELSKRLAAHGSGLSPSELVIAYSDSLRAFGATGVCSGLIDVRRPADDSPARREVRIVTDGSRVRGDVIPREGDGLELTHDESALRASMPGSAAVILEGPTAALLSAVDGTRTIAELVTKAWGTHPAAARQDLVDQAIARLNQLALVNLVQL
ncbi:MAG: methyltransferase protein [Acidimicrobiaceae bacterium]|nr:methyltransferase protein [Acidimicrobiaceae bacterium]